MKNSYFNNFRYRDRIFLFFFVKYIKTDLYFLKIEYNVIFQN